MTLKEVAPSGARSAIERYCKDTVDRQLKRRVFVRDRSNVFEGTCHVSSPSTVVIKDTTYRSGLSTGCSKGRSRDIIFLVGGALITPLCLLEVEDVYDS